MNNNYGKQRGNGGFGGQQTDTRYVGAPYNFVPFSTRVLSVEEQQMKNRAALKEELLSGEIGYKVTAKSEIFIGSGKDKGFSRDEYRRYIIPGSSMRGLIRSNAQILGMADVGDDIDDYNLMYRSVGGRKSSLKRRYEDALGAESIKAGAAKQSTISVLLNVKAGYIVKKENGYVIYPVQGKAISPERGEMNYYILSERDVQKQLDDYPLFKNHPEYAMHDLTKPFVKGTDKKGRTIYVGTKNNNYTAGYYKISFSVTGKGTVTGLAEPGRLSREGFLMNTGFMNNKKVHYIIPEIDSDESKAIDVSEKDQKAFQIDFESKKNTLGPNKAFFSLPENDQPKPVFYIEKGGRLYFGFTPRLRIFYDNSVKGGFKKSNVQFDFAKSIFGMSNNTESYRSKVSFSDAVLANQVQNPISKRVILASPKPTSYWDYLVQKGEDAVTYNDDFTLRGIKQYWLRDHIDPQEGFPPKNEKVSSSIQPLPAGSEFKGTVHFQNLTEVELGLLLWAMYVDQNARFNIGMGKPLGYGVIKIDDISVWKFDLNTAYSVKAGLNLSPFSELSVQDLIAKYKSYVKEEKEIDIEKQESVKAFILMKTRVPNADKIRYMSIDNREYQNRTRALGRVEDVLDIKDTEADKKKAAEEQKAKKEQRNADAERKAKEEQQTVYKKRMAKAAEGLQVGDKRSGTVIEITKKGLPKVKIDGITEPAYLRSRDITFETISTRALKTKFPVGTRVTLKYRGNTDGKPLWECIEILK